VQKLEQTTPPEGLRERKRRQTLQRITEVGLKLFLEKGYDATTLDEIAAAAGISRRTFFYYFKSKEDILLTWRSGGADTLRNAVLENASAGAPIDTVRAALLKLSIQLQSSKAIKIARLVRENEALRATRQANFMILEQTLYEALCELWPGKQRRDGLRLVAMASIGALRLSIETWSQEDGKRPLAKYIADAFEKLKAEI
jgi:AcrR family transcriptional regulator